MMKVRIKYLPEGGSTTHTEVCEFIGMFEEETFLLQDEDGMFFLPITDFISMEVVK